MRNRLLLIFFLLLMLFAKELKAQCGTHPDYETLMAFYDNTNGSGWTNNIGWKEGKKGTNCDPCKGWFGVVCENSRVTQILLEDNNLQGQFVDLSKMRELKKLYVGSNELNGQILDLSKNVKLEDLSCGYNNLNGKIPDISKNPNLKYFLCDKNQLTGELPNFSLNEKLKIFRCGFNKLGGQIPNLSYNINLEGFICSNNLLAGKIPDLSRNVKLASFDCSQNMLSGEIPDLSQLINLSGFSCSGNMLTGNIPDLSKNLNLGIFFCSNNELTGPIPKFNFSLPNFLYNCEYNDLSGCYPLIICNKANNVSFIGNLKLPWQGDHFRLCSGESQIGASCNDLDSTTINDVINTNCECKGESISLCGSHPDYNTLIALYDSTDGDGWKNNTGWKEGKAGTNCDPCNGWFGIKCTNSRVSSIELSSNNLDGVLTSLDKLDSNLIVFNCSINQLIGGIPDLSNNLNLANFSCNGNQISSKIPDLSKNSNLRSFVCNRNQIVGEIPDLSKNENLNIFECAFNRITGKIPDLSKNIRLFQFSCRGNQIFGEIPDLSNNSNLINFSCDLNQITGKIPNLSNNIILRNFHCGYNQITDKIPDLSKNIRLKSFICLSNNLNGEIPDLSKNVSLEIFECGLNQITGKIPNLAENINLTYFGCSENQITFEIPDLSKNVNLVSFYCHKNQISGQIPDLRNNISLSIFDCSSNVLSGCYNESICRGNTLTFSSLYNSRLPWNGDHTKFCAGESQLGASCDDLAPTTIKDVINANCECKGESINLCGSHPDYKTLMALFDSTNGYGWINNTGWGEGKAGTNCDPCNGWFGVGCENGRVVTLSLPANNLKGQLVDISAIVDLKTLTIFGNNLVGKIPDFSFNLKLEEFYCGNNSLEGEIPDLSKNPNLKYFFCDNNQLTGEIPSFSIDDKMLIFRCSFNKLVGQIPNLSNNVNLEAFICSNNLLTGIIADLSRNIKILNFDCSRNMLTGEIPDLSKNINLNGFNCGGNMLTGKIPDLSNNLNLRIFLCNNNQLTGPIPKFNYSVPNFLYFCEYNDLSGCYPFELCNSTTSGSFSFIGNPKLPWEGDHKRFCTEESQTGATCDDMDNNTLNDIINENCECKGIKRIPCDSIKLNADYYIINENEKNTLDIFANDILTTQGLLSTDKVNINVVRSPNVPIVIKVDKDLVTVEISSSWSDTIVLQYTLTRESCPNSTSSYIYLINKSVFEESLCSQVILNRDTYNGLKSEEILLDVLNNDFVNSIPFTQAADLGIKYEISKFTLPKNVKSSLTERSGEYYLTIEEDWIDTLFATYELCITFPCDTCLTMDIGFVNEALKELTLVTIFSPDGDGINDVLKFSDDSELKDSELWIFNRYGTQVYHKKDYTNDWEASGFGGGVYYYVLNFGGIQIKKLLTIVK